MLQRNIILPGGCHKGELTKLGQQQAREVGEWLRQRYVDQLGFLPAQYEVYVLVLVCLSQAYTTCVAAFTSAKNLGQNPQICSPSFLNHA